jgi:hypothetical protein
MVVPVFDNSRRLVASSTRSQQVTGTCPAIAVQSLLTQIVEDDDSDADGDAGQPRSQSVTRAQTARFGVNGTAVTPQR